MIAPDLVAAIFGAIGYSIPAELLHRRKLRRQIAATELLLEQARRLISEQAVDKMALLGRLEASQVEAAARQAELIDLYYRLAVPA